MRTGAAGPPIAGSPDFSPGPSLVPSITTMKLDATDLRYVTSEEFRVLTAVWNHFVATSWKVIDRWAS